MEQHATNTVIIGAGPAGLAVGACLKRAGISFEILEGAGQVGSAWRGHYQRLHLHTDKARSQLPFFPYPKDYPRYPSRLQVVQYLEDYARHWGLQPRFGQEVAAARRQDGLWLVQTRDGEYRGENLVVASGNTRQPFVPQWPGQDGFPGPLLHSAQYKDGEPFKGQRVLVVGFGNSGGEIAIDLCEHGARPDIAVRSPVNIIPRELFGLPILAIALVASKLPAAVADGLTAPILRLLYGDLERLGLRKKAYGPIAQIKRDGRIPLIDIGTVALIKEGSVGVRPGVERFAGDQVHFSDGQHAAYDAVILATGYRPRLDGILPDDGEALDGQGAPRSSGAEVAPGLFCCGFAVPPTGVLREIAKEAQAIAAAIQGKQGASAG